ncbi:hypothetical protein [Phenylobacterium sp.]|jgi:hypothetical protein|uniref:hypothetical protein n=1 Tax=Phenylobacterium sp. TaxID=1871053 RepID=UPI0011FD233E|nr:hypothetical protein [Phenylobacterium sp.]THD62079.1 MAG: hypothetical protein E8A12_09660 [Phenylobacterium sp.]
MSDSARRYAFVIEAVDAPGTLVRVLTLFAVQPLDLANVSMVRGESGCAIRVEADGLDPQRAETLLRRLDGLAVVCSVGLGWRGPVQVAVAGLPNILCRPPDHATSLAAEMTG